MPEGHTLHRLATDLTATFGGQAVSSTSPQGRFDAGASRLDGHVLWRAEAWGKHLLIDFTGVRERVHVHLGIYGSFVIARSDHPVVGQVRWRVASRRAVADLRGPTVCELLEPDAADELIARLGPDPLRPDADPELAWQRITASRAPIATLLMDQRVLSGVGNVYRAELLFRHRVDPDLEGRRLDRGTFAAMWDDLTTLMSAGERTGRIDTVDPEHEPAAMGRDPRVDDHGGEVYVYRRTDQACLVCGTAIRTRVLAGRNLFWCPSCQQGG
ncbi:Fpg/Nei family DNA glycosylase [Aeromicrobium panaciterrae]|uniref:Fpg/Nei family DNA glycosylase n=1 Tax=Aeromicrobium panaciterrae TaxID=363861 RepID=UPI0031D05C7A